MVDPTLAIGTAGVIIILGILIMQLSEKLKFPGVLLLILLGILLGPLLKFFNPLSFRGVLQNVVLFALIVVLFDSGYLLRVKQLLGELKNILEITFYSVFFSVVAVTLLSFLLFKFTWQQSLLMGAILASTDITIISPLIKIYNLKPNVKNILTMEAALNSVVAILLATLTVDILFKGVGFEAVEAASKAVLTQILVGISLGLLFGYMLIFILKHLRVESRPEILSIGAILIIYSLSEFIGASGIFAVFLSAIVLGNARQDFKKIMTFESNIARLLIIFVFVIFGASLSAQALKVVGFLGIFFLVFFVLSRVPAAYLINKKWDENAKTLFLLGPRGMTGVVLVLFYMDNFPNPTLALGLVFAGILATIMLSAAFPFFVKVKKPAKVKAVLLKKR
jgi:cell volume regulation protein A